MFWFKKNIISSQVVKGKSDKLMRHVLRDAGKKIKNEELIDGYSFEMYLQTVDAQFAHLKNEISSATQTANYTTIRAEKIAETRQLLDFFNHDNADLARLNQIVIKKAAEAKRIDDLKHEKLAPVDISDLKDEFNELLRKDEEK
jgi:hypothetical protein